MKLHLPVRLFRAIIALMVATTMPIYVPAYAEPAASIPEGYEEPIEVDEYVDMSKLSSDTKDYVFLLTDDIISDNATSRLLLSGAGSRFLTSSNKENRHSIYTTNTPSRLFYVSSSETLTLTGLNVVSIKQTKGTSDGSSSALFSISSYGNLLLDNNKFLSFTDNNTVISCGYGGKVKFSNNETINIQENGSYGTIMVQTISFEENGDISFVKNRLTSTNGNNGGAIEATGTIDFVLNNNLLFTGNSANSGGAIYSEDAITFSQNVGDILFQDNTAQYGGGAIYTKKTFCLTITKEK